MRYCEDYVITCAIEVWRGNENARVEYKRGEPGNVTVGGIDAPERLAEVMRVVVGQLPHPRPAAQAPGRGAQAAAGRRRGGRQGPRARAVGAGCPAAERHQDHVRHAGRRDHQGARRRRGRQGRSAPPRPAPRRRRAPPCPRRRRRPPAPRRHRRASAAPPPAAAPVKATPPGVAASQVPAPVARASASSATKTIFGVPTPGAPGGYTPVTQPSPTPAPAPVAAAPVAAASAPAADDRGKTGARKVAVPGPEVSPLRRPPMIPLPRTRVTTPARPPRRPSGRRRPCPSQSRPRHPPRPPRAARPRGSAPRRRRRRSGPTSASVSTFGLALIGIYQLVGMLAH